MEGQADGRCRQRPAQGKDRLHLEEIKSKGGVFHTQSRRTSCSVARTNHAHIQQGRRNDPAPSGYSVAGRRGDLRGKVRLVLFYTLAEGEADEAGELYGGAELLAGRLDRLLDGLVRVEHERLLQEGDLLVELAQPALDHLFDDVLRLAGFAGLLREDGALALDHRRVEVVDAERQRAGRGNVHGDLPAEFVKLCLLG